MSLLNEVQEALISIFPDEPVDYGMATTVKSEIRGTMWCSVGELFGQTMEMRLLIVLMLQLFEKGMYLIRISIGVLRKLVQFPV